MDNNIYSIVDAALGVMVSGPTSLSLALSVAPKLAGINGEVSESQLFAHLADASADDPIRNRVRQSLVAWDYDSDPEWASGTERNSERRRSRIYQRLELQPESIELLNRSLPFAVVDPVIVIAEGFERWYTTERRRAHSYYWDVYRNYLGEVRGFEPENLEGLDEATTAVVERLTDPERLEAYQAKGLVVGYVQSGKTANFTGVIAKALDAGYRLIIVLSGTMDLLRDQTQRRIDMELVGKEQIVRHIREHDRHDYDDDPAWGRAFLSHGSLPSDRGAFDILRLTGAGQVRGAVGDYQSLRAGIQTLEIEKVDRAKPLFNPTNLHRASARLMVVKKNAARLGKLVEDLGRIGAGALSEIPALIIDDESDQASVNTIRPDKDFAKSERNRRTTINNHLVNLLGILPRAQYVGYTATPFANVFVDPDDVADIFPKDFIVSLPRPAGYMGVTAFHDPEPVTDPTPSNSNERAYVRSVSKPHEESTTELVRAIDTFVLTGAIKLYRSSQDSRFDFRHHTMLVHESQRQSDHAALADLISDLWSNAGYDGGAGVERLREVLRDDILPVSRARAQGLSTPESIDEIRAELGESIRRIEDGLRPLLIVNGTRDAETPDFDKVPVWKIIVGGAKLSRGYTVEGLTVSYFRRRATYQDTLMQMGRWFGFRPGYEDLVRLYIGRHEPMTPARRRFIDLYEAFGSICLDEEEFRAELQRYALPADGSEPLTPKEVPPLVSNSHPQLMPVGPSRMFNAQLKSRNFGGAWIERTLVSDVTADLKLNSELFGGLLSEIDLQEDEFATKSQGKRQSAPGFGGIASHTAILKVLKDYLWAEPNRSSLMALEIAFLEGAFGDPSIDDWFVYVPQIQSERTPWRAAGRSFSTVQRSRIDNGGRFKVFTEPRHRRVVEIITGRQEGETESQLAKTLAQTPKRGGLILYPAYPPKDDDRDWPEDLPAMGFALLPPTNSLPKRLAFGPRDPQHPDAVTISARG